MFFFLNGDQSFMSGDHFIVLGAWSTACFFKLKTMSVNWEGSIKVPSSSPQQGDFLAGQVTFKA